MYLKFSIDQQKALVSNFYKSLSFDLGEKAAKILYDLIEKEIEGIDWHKGKPISKTRRKKLKKYTIIFLIFFLIFLTFSLAEAAFNIVNLCLIIFYFFILY